MEKSKIAMIEKFGARGMIWETNEREPNDVGAFKKRQKFGPSFSKRLIEYNEKRLIWQFSIAEGNVRYTNPACVTLK